QLVADDEPRLDPVWEEFGRLGIPVAIHVSDPEAFFHPVDARNERYEELTEHPDWSFYGHGFPSKEAIIAARDRMFARHPHTTFISLHVVNWPEDLEYVSALLDRLPNVVVEFGARAAELGRQPRRAGGVTPERAPPAKRAAAPARWAEKTATAVQVSAKATACARSKASPYAKTARRNCSVGERYWRNPSVDSGSRRAAAAKKRSGTAVTGPPRRRHRSNDAFPARNAERPEAIAQTR